MRTTMYLVRKKALFSCKHAWLPFVVPGTVTLDLDESVGDDFGHEKKVEKLLE